MFENAVLELQNIDKAYNGRKVLSNLTLHLFAGECVALTGENGCGKSTLLKVAAGLSRPDNGKVVSNPGSSTQFVPDHFPPIQMTGRHFLDLMARVDCEADEEMIRQFHMDAYLDQSISHYSKGMRSKIGVLQALLARPKLLIMDEPISGQDASAQEAFIEAVKALMQNGCAVLMACHEQALISALSSSVYRIVHGTLVRENWLCQPSEAICLCEHCALHMSGSCRGRQYNHA